MTHWPDELRRSGSRAAGRSTARRRAGYSAAADAEVPELLRATARVRERHCGKRVKLCQLRNARSGLVPRTATTARSRRSPRRTSRVTGSTRSTSCSPARAAAVAAGARRFCMVTSGRGPSENDIARFCAAARSIKAEQPEIELCVSAGLMDESQARALKAAGIDFVNHNLNTSARHPRADLHHAHVRGSACGRSKPCAAPASPPAAAASSEWARPARTSSTSPSPCASSRSIRSRSTS